MKITINEFLENPVEHSDECFNFFDWFCKTSSLERRMLALVPKLKFLVKEGIINGDTNYVWFKNNCPLVGTLYDDIRISNLNGDFLGGFCPTSGHHVEDKCIVWTLKGKCKEYNFKNWSSFKKEIKSNTDLRNVLIDNFK